MPSGSKCVAPTTTWMQRASRSKWLAQPSPRRKRACASIRTATNRACRQSADLLACRRSRASQPDGLLGSGLSLSHRLRQPGTCKRNLKFSIPRGDAMNRMNRAVCRSLCSHRRAWAQGCPDARTNSKWKIAQPETVSDVSVIVVHKTTVPDWLEAVGTVRAAQTSQVASQMMGNIRDIRVQEGDRVQSRPNPCDDRRFPAARRGGAGHGRRCCGRKRGLRCGFGPCARRSDAEALPATLR